MHVCFPGCPTSLQSRMFYLKFTCVDPNELSCITDPHAKRSLIWTDKSPCDLCFYRPAASFLVLCDPIDPPLCAHARISCTRPPQTVKRAEAMIYCHVGKNAFKHLQFIPTGPRKCCLYWIGTQTFHAYMHARTQVGREQPRLFLAGLLPASISESSHIRRTDPPGLSTTHMHERIRPSVLPSFLTL